MSYNVGMRDLKVFHQVDFAGFNQSNYAIER